MKLAIILFLLLNPFQQPGTLHQPDKRSFDRYIPMQRNVTSLLKDR